jgi:hypothetical protein
LLFLLEGLPSPFYQVSETQPCSVTYPSLEFNRTFEKLRGIDFRNLTFPDFAFLNRKWLKFRDGEFTEIGEHGRSELWIREIHYLPKSKDGVDRAVILIDGTSVGGSSSNSGYVLVLELRNGVLQISQMIHADTDVLRGEDDPRSMVFSSKNGRLVVKSSHYEPGDAHCCISSIDVVSFRWTGMKFEQVSVKKVPSSYGLQKSKKPS